MAAGGKVGARLAEEVPELQSCEIWHAVRRIWHGARDFAGGSPVRDFVPSGVALVLAWARFVQLPDPRPRRSRHLPIDTTIKSLDSNFEVAPANKIQGAQLSTLFRSGECQAEGRLVAFRELAFLRLRKRAGC